jgi:hypothetical protein
MSHEGMPNEVPETRKEAAMNEAATKERILEIIDTFATSPTFGAANISADSNEGIYIPHLTNRDSSLDDCLDQLRMDAKYMLFDLEATKRENRYLRQMLAGRSNNNNSNNASDDPQT